MISRLLSATLNNTVNGVAKLRLYLVAQQTNNTTVPLNTLAVDEFLTVDYAGYLK